MALKSIAVLGAGGFAREVCWLISDINRTRPTYDFAGYLVSDLHLLTGHDSHDQILGDFSWLDDNAHRIDCFAIGIGTPAARLKVVADLEQKLGTVDWTTLVHPSVQLDQESCSIGKGVILCAGVIGTVNIVVEPFVMANLSCTIGHEARLGRGTVLNPTVNVSGGVMLGEAVLVGTGAQVLQYVNVGAGATIGAGAVVTKNVSERQTVVGVPARPMSK